MKMIIGLTLTLLFMNSRAFEVVLVNEASVPIIPRVQPAGSSCDAPDQEGLLASGDERAYDNANAWLSTPLMNVQEGNIRTMSVVTNAQVVKCGSITFHLGTVVTYTADGQCSTAPMHTIDSEDGYSFWIDIRKYAWIIADYAEGPTTYIWEGGAEAKTTVTFHAVEHTSKATQDIDTLMSRSNECLTRRMNDAITCTRQTKTSFTADKYDASLNPDLPSGHYSGLAKVKGQRWDDAGDVKYFYLNLEVTVNWSTA